MWFKNKPCAVVCVGSVSKDIFFPTDEAIILKTPEDITAKEKIAFELGGKYKVADRYEAVGGVAANVATGLTRLGHRVACYSQVGGDEIGRYILEELKKENVATETLSVDDKVKSDLSAIIVVTQSGERTIFHNRDANEKLRVEESRLPETEWLFVSALNGEWKKNMDTLLALKEKRGLKLAINPGQHNIKSDPEYMLEVISRADLLLLNKDEAIELLLHSPEQKQKAGESLENERFLLSTLHSHGAKVIGLTDGKRGAWATDGKEYWHGAIYMPQGLVDTTGAGDGFGSGFFAAHLSEKSIKESLSYGIANGGSVVGYYGASEGLLTPETMETVLQMISPLRLS